jgi:hypothetical protein
MRPAPHGTPGPEGAAKPRRGDADAAGRSHAGHQATEEGRGGPEDVCVVAASQVVAVWPGWGADPQAFSPSCSCRQRRGCASTYVRTTDLDTSPLGDSRTLPNLDQPLTQVPMGHHLVAESERRRGQLAHSAVGAAVSCRRCCPRRRSPPSNPLQNPTLAAPLPLRTASRSRARSDASAEAITDKPAGGTKFRPQRPQRSRVRRESATTRHRR